MKVMVERNSVNVILTKETPMANCGPNAVLVIHLKGCLSAVQLRQDCFGLETFCGNQAVWS